MNPTNNNTEWTSPLIHVQASTVADEPRAAKVLSFLHGHDDTQDAVLIPCADEKERSDAGKAAKRANHWRLLIGEELPCLYRPDGVGWRIDFRSAKSQRRAAESDRTQQPLSRALGISKLSADERKSWHIVDGTAGAGRDGWQLAAAGAKVTWVEQHPVLFTLLHEALSAAYEDAATQAIAENIHVINGRIENIALDQTTHLQTPANAVYLDPMYPVRRSKAAVKKPMQFIQALVGGGPDPKTMVLNCIDALCHPELNRVVVKRPSEAPPLVNAEQAKVQQVSIDAGAARFDVYLKP